MNTPYITLTNEELFSLSPEVRQKVREAVTPKRTSPNKEATSVSLMTEYDSELPFAATEELISPEATASLTNSTPPPGTIVAEDPHEVYLKTVAPGDPFRVIVALESHALRSIHLLFNNKEKVESISDGGCQIVAMSEAVCHDLGLIYDPTVILNMESANGEINPSLGMARNVPCQIGNITIYLQIHVIREPAYDILLGRPFDVLTRSSIQNFSDGNQTITIHDPNSNQVATIPTFPRRPPCHRLNKMHQHQHHCEDSDF